MQAVLKVVGTLLIVFATFLLSLLALAAAKGFLTARGLILDFPARGRVVPVSPATIVTLVLIAAIVGVLTLALGNRAHKKGIPPTTEQPRPR